MAKYTITFDEKVKGWTSFHTYYPDFMLRVNNAFYTLKEGQLYEHHVDEIGYNNFYGEQFSSAITTVLNDASSFDKVYKTLVLESEKEWEATLKTNYTESHIKSNEFNQRESRWYAYLRKNENELDFNKVSQGLGTVQNINGLVLDFFDVPNNISVNDVLYQSLNGVTEVIGAISGIDGNSVTVASFFNAPNYDAFCFGKKVSRIEGSEMRGYYLEVTLEDATSEKNELFAIGCETVKSFL